MAETNGHAPELVAPIDTASSSALDALLQGLFEPVLVELAPGRSLEVRPLVLKNADTLYAGGLVGAALQRFLLARCVFLEGRPLGDELAATLPVALANRLVPVVMNVNGMEQPAASDDDGPAPDPKA